MLFRSLRLLPGIILFYILSNNNDNKILHFQVRRIGIGFFFFSFLAVNLKQKNLKTLMFKFFEVFLIIVC